MTRDRTFLVSSAVVFMVSLDATVVVAAFPALRASFPGASPGELSWTLNAYTIVYAALLLPMGRIADVWGRARLFLRGVAVFTLASAACSVAWDPLILSAFRILQAVGAAAVTPTSLALILAATPVEGRSRVISGWTAVGAFAAALGPGLGSFIIETWSWPVIFALNVPAGVWAWAAGRSLLAADRRGEVSATPDLAGSALLALAVGAWAAGIVQLGEHGWTSRSGLMLIGSGTGLLGLWMVRRPVPRDASAGPGPFADRQFRQASLATFGFGAALSLMFLSFYLFMTDVWGYSQSRAGAAATLGPLVAIAVIVATAGLAAQRGPRRMLVVGGLAFAASQLWYSTNLVAEPDYLGSWLPGQLLGAFGIGLVLPNLTAASVSRISVHRMGEGNAINATLRQLGGAVGTALTIALVGRASTDLEPYRIVYLVSAAGGLAVAGLGWAMEKR